MPKKITTPTKIESIRHKDKRANIPTEELRDFVAEDALSARFVARSATGLEGEGRAGPLRPRRPRGADLHPGKDSPAGHH